ncbi:imidazolonepropionase [Marinobacterium sedimentorum]|uniref:imidazolonepropionase n=1 Tax=Marinobacterium sedimentorum TaxID=2927804 RepID=UPI0020C6E5F0|nr:imidazolonepropionase [Marinobacterium sedimentorum]MCP8686087.1 imidazolonepropionase [Marinobacterium sedimentorum]
MYIQTTNPKVNAVFDTCERIWINANLATFDAAVQAGYGALAAQAIGVREGRIVAIAPMSAFDASAVSAEIIDARGGWMTPGLVDAHTHLVFAGSRAQEFEQRLKGVSYEEIARNGGGIISTVRATRSATVAELVRLSEPRLQALMREGVTSVEIKSGYGLSLEDELKMLRAARLLGERNAVRVSTSLLAAHALPPEFSGNADGYIDLICNEIIPAAVAEGLVDAVDVFCESIAFSPAQCERVFKAAQQHGLGVRAHVEQLSNLHGAALAARYGAWSVDHLEWLDEEGVQAMAASGTVATLLPGAFYFLRDTRVPPIELLRQHGVGMAVATDLNPGSSPLASIRLAMNMACTLFRLTPEEALAGCTRFGARGLGLEGKVGELRVGMQADMVLWDIDHPAELAYQFGVNLVRERIVAGEVNNV